MFDLQKRKLLEVFGSTNEYVGPGTYTIDEIPYKIKHPKPFLCGAKRIKTIKNYTEAIYYPKPTDKITGGSTISNKAPRFNYRLDQWPGPAAYEVRDGDNYSDSDTEKPKRRGRLYVGRVPYSIESAGVSVPTRRDQSGYSIDEYGRLVKNPPCDCDTTLGPAFYYLPGELGAREQLYRGCHWSKSKSKRATSVLSDIPGPGTPKLISELCKSRYSCYKIQQKCVSEPRFTDQIIRKAKEENLPAPCDYNVTKLQRKTQLKAPFYQTAERVTMKVTSDSPAPNKYKIRECICKQQIISSAPFLVGTKRFKYPQKDRVGPGTYVPKNSLADQLQKNVERTKFVRAAFLSSTIRDSSFTDGEVDACVAPNQYCVIGNNVCSPYLKDMENSVFRSKTERFPPLERSDEPDPSTYNTDHGYKFVYGKKSFRKTNTKIKDGFLSSVSDRFQPYFDFASPFKTGSLPGPGYYDIPDDSLNKGRTFPRVLRSTRVKNEDLPGPNTYKISGAIADGMFKAKFTYNRRLAESVTKKLRIPSTTTTASFKKRVLGRKRLVCFLAT